MKKSILLFSLLIVFILSLFINFDIPEITLRLQSDSPNINPPEISISQSGGQAAERISYRIMSSSDCYMVIGLRNYETSFQRNMLNSFAIIISGAERTEELLRQDIVIPLREGVSAEFDVIRNHPFKWHYLGRIYKLSALTGTFILLYGLSLFFLNYRKEILSFFDKDWPHEIVVFFKNINPLYYKTFIACFIAMNIVFLYHTVHFIWGNHDWGFVKYGFPWFGTLWGGRLTENIFAKLLYGGKVLPVFCNFFNFASFSLTAVLLCIIWKIPKNLFSYISVSLLLVLSPYTLGWLYVTNMIHFTVPAIVIAAMIVALKSVEEADIKRKYVFNAISVFLLIYAFFAYPPVLNTIAVVFCGMFFMEYFFEEKNLKEIFFKSRYVIADVFMSGILFKIALYILPLFASTVDSRAYMTQNVDFTGFIKGFFFCVNAAFMQFVLTQPFLDSFYKWTLLIMISVSIISVILYACKVKRNIATVFMAFFIYLVAMISTQSSSFLAVDKSIAFQPRIAMFGLLFFYIFSFAVIIRHKGNVFRNIAFVLFIVICQASVVRDVNAQKIWKLGFDAERENILKLAYVIESHSSFDPSKKYIYVAFGKQHSYRENYYNEEYDIGDALTLNYPYTPEWIPHVPLQFYSKNNYIENGYSIYRGCFTPVDVQHRINDDLADFKANAKPWPAQGSVLVNDKYIAVMFDRESL